MNNFDQFEVVTIDKKDYENLVKDSERMAQAMTEAIIILKTESASVSYVIGLLKVGLKFK